MEQQLEKINRQRSLFRNHSQMNGELCSHKLTIGFKQAHPDTP